MLSQLDKRSAHLTVFPLQVDRYRARLKKFDYELACAELCGNGHYSMRRIVEIVSEEEYDRWLGEQTPYYESAIKKDEPAVEEESAVTEGETSEADAEVTEEAETEAEH